MNREFVMLAHVYRPEKDDVAGWYMSTKMDGQRAFWDGGYSRGLLKREIPWANIAKDERYREEQVATGLWSRLGNVIHAPDFFLDQLPEGILLDGELYIDRGRFQETRTIVSRLTPDIEDWKRVRYMVFDSPPPETFFKPGKITNCKVTFGSDSLNLFLRRFKDYSRSFFEYVVGNEVLTVEQVKLPEKNVKSFIYDALVREVNLGGEGLILRNPWSFWTPKRTRNLLKVKPFVDDDARIVDFVWGEGKHEGRMGAMIVEWRDKTFELGTGFTDEERELVGGDKIGTGIVSPDWRSLIFIRGACVTFRFTSLTDDGIPREARYYRC